MSASSEQAIEAPAMIVGIGMDVVEIERIRDLVQRHAAFLTRTFAPLDMSRLDADLYCLRIKTEMAPGIPARRRAARCRPDRGARRFAHRLPAQRGEAAR